MCLRAAKLRSRGPSVDAESLLIEDDVVVSTASGGLTSPFRTFGLGEALSGRGMGVGWAKLPSEDEDDGKSATFRAGSPVLSMMFSQTLMRCRDPISPKT